MTTNTIEKAPRAYDYKGPVTYTICLNFAPIQRQEATERQFGVTS